jgi:arsenate reductase
MSVTIYGIRNCDTIKRARAWLDAHHIAYRFHDYRVDGVDEAQLARWSAALGWEKLLNRAGTTFRALPEAEREGLDRDKAMRLMLAQPAMIKRPVLEHPGGLLLGFDAGKYAQALL